MMDMNINDCVNGFAIYKSLYALELNFIKWADKVENTR